MQRLERRARRGGGEAVQMIEQIQINSWVKKEELPIMSQSQDVEGRGGGERSARSGRATKGSSMYPRSIPQDDDAS